MANMGLGEIGKPGVVHKRKFRWTFRVVDICGQQIIPHHFVKLASRPNLTIEETEINFLNGKTWIPGKASWETITVTYYDVKSDGGEDNRALWNWICSLYEYTNPATLKQSSKRSDYAGLGQLNLFDGCGGVMEQWVLGDMWPQAVNFGELDYSSSEECTIELTLRYSQVRYSSKCPPFDPKSCCKPC